MRAIPPSHTHTHLSCLPYLSAMSCRAGETRMAAAAPPPSGQPDAHGQHTILHMVSIPGCIQLLVSVAQWRPVEGAATEHGAASSSAAAAGHTSHPHAGQEGTAASSSTTAAAEGPEGTTSPAVQQGVPQGVAPSSSISSSSWVVTPQGTHQLIMPAGSAGDTGDTMPAPAWLLHAVCKAVEELLRSSSTPQQGTSGAAAAAHEQQQGHAQHSGDGPVLLSFNGTLFALEPDAADPDAAWLLGPYQGPPPTAGEGREEGLQEQPGEQHQLAVIGQLQQQTQVTGPGQHGSDIVEPASSEPTTSAAAQAASTAAHTSRASLERQHPPAAAAAEEAAGGTAAARKFVRTVARGVAAMHVQGGSGLFAAATPVAATDTAAAATAATAAAAGLDPADSDPAGAAGSSSSSSSRPAVMQLSTSSVAAHVLPPGMWAWPLYLAVAGDPASAAAAADVRVAVCGSSAALPVVSLHGLMGVSSCRVVLSAAGGAVLMDTRVPVEDGVVRWAAGWGFRGMRSSSGAALL